MNVAVMIEAQFDDIAIVVEARSGFTSRAKDKNDRLSVHKGDRGILQWQAHRRYPSFLQPAVVWDRDPKRRARRVLWSLLAVAGLQAAGTRIMVVLVPLLS